MNHNEELKNNLENELQSIVRDIAEERNFPKHPIPAGSIEKYEPGWPEYARQHYWWESDNINSSTTVLKFLLPKDLEVDSEEALKTACSVRWLLGRFAFLHRLLLTIGGCETEFDIADYIVPLLREGRYFPGNAELSIGKTNQAGKNVFDYWSLHKDAKELSIFKGFALHKNGLWTKHFWLVETPEGTSKPKVIETINQRLAYFGAKLTGEQLDFFVNYEEHIL